MNLKERLMADLKDAMRSQDTHRKDAIRMVRAAIVNKEIELRREVTDAEVEQLISQEVKRREEALQLFKQAGREDLITKEQIELQILQSYLPEQLSQEEIERVVQGIVAELGAKDRSQMGPVMRRAMEELRGRADGRLVNDIVRETLNKE
jgi:uncharacterized protein YqeY